MRALFILLLLCGAARAGEGEVRIWPTLGAVRNTVGNLTGTDAYGATIDCSTLLPGECVQKAYDIAFPRAMPPVGVSLWRDLRVNIGYGGTVPFVADGGQNQRMLFTGAGFYLPVLKSCEMGHISFEGTQVDELVFSPDDQGTPDGDDLFGIATCHYFVQTTFHIDWHLPAPVFDEDDFVIGGSVGASNSTFEIQEMLNDRDDISCGWHMPTLKPFQGFFQNKIKFRQIHRDKPNVGHFTLICNGESALPAGTFLQQNIWEVVGDVTDGTTDGLNTYGSLDTIHMAVVGFTTGKVIWFHAGACGNTADIESPNSNIVIQDDGACPADKPNRVTVNGVLR